MELRQGELKDKLRDAGLLDDDQYDDGGVAALGRAGKNGAAEMGQGLADIAHRVTECHLTQETKVQGASDERRTGPGGCCSPRHRVPSDS